MNLSTQRADTHTKKRAIPLAELAVFAMFAALMFCSKKVMEFLPNIHLLGMFTMLLTVVYRSRALIPIYLYVLLEGLFGGFTLWWMPYLYIWTVLWGITMLLPRNMSKKTAAIVYPVVCGLHGLLFGILYAPAQALLFHLDFRAALAWIAAGLPFDAVHAAGNVVTGLLVLPLRGVLQKLKKRAGG